jgi:RND family efflux transporter MFP subunit
MNKSKIVILSVFAALISISSGLAQGGPPVLVETDSLQRAEFHTRITLVGRSEARTESRIVSEVSGIVREIKADEGVYVDAEAPLLVVDDEAIHLDLAAKRAEVKQARLEADLAASQLARAERLFKQELIPETSLDSARAWSGIAEARHGKLVAESKTLERDLRNCTILAPFPGHTVKRLVDIGEWVNPGMPVYEMVDLSTVIVRVDLPERHFGNLSIGSPVDISVKGQTEFNIVGQVTGIAPNASPETHTFPVIVEVNNDDGQLGGGMLVRARLSLDDRFTSLAVSKDAIIRQGLQTLIYTVADGKAAPVYVTTGATDGKMVAVEGDGLNTGMPVIVRGNERVYPGSPVRISGNMEQTFGAR